MFDYFSIYTHTLGIQVPYLRFGTTGPETGTYITWSNTSPYLRRRYDWIPGHLGMDQDLEPSSTMYSSRPTRGRSTGRSGAPTAPTAICYLAFFLPPKVPCSPHQGGVNHRVGPALHATCRSRHQRWARPRRANLARRTSVRGHCSASWR